MKRCSCRTKHSLGKKTYFICELTGQTVCSKDCKGCYEGQNPKWPIFRKPVRR